jgi:hypothetical protein
MYAPCLPSHITELQLNLAYVADKLQGVPLIKHLQEVSSSRHNRNSGSSKESMKPNNKQRISELEHVNINR